MSYTALPTNLRWTHEPAPFDPQRPAWQNSAACKGADADAFFADDATIVAAAKAICRACPVTAECLAYALDNNERFGVWGGRSTNERNAMRRRTRTAEGVKP